MRSASSATGRSPGGDLLRSLIEDPGAFVSGQALARGLGITRAALWKRIGMLRDRGFRIEGRPGSGYRLAASPELSAEEIEASVRGSLGLTVLYRQSVVSTNDVALELAAAGASHGMAVVADRQEHGRGRLGRSWVSPPAVNIYLSIIVRPGLSPRDSSLLTLASAVAGAKALKQHTGLPVLIKWPNDLVACSGTGQKSGCHKLGGILVETRTEPDRLLYAVAGIGVNVNTRRADFPPEFTSTATSLYLETGRTFRRSVIAAAILDALEMELQRVEGVDREKVIAACREFSATIGEWVRVDAGRLVITGRALDIEEDGALLVRDEKGLHRHIYSGDVTLLR